MVRRHIQHKNVHRVRVTKSDLAADVFLEKLNHSQAVMVAHSEFKHLSCFIEDICMEDFG